MLNPTWPDIGWSGRANNEENNATDLVLMITLDSDSPVPAYLQIRDRVVSLIEGGVLAAGDRLPPTRSLAHTVGVHRSTVVRAYDEIRALGYLESRSGAYTTVRHRARPPATLGHPLAARPGVDWQERLTAPARAVDRWGGQRPRSDTPADVIDLEHLAIDPALAPTAELRKCLRHLLLRSGREVLDYADPRGWWPLREAISLRLRTHGVAVTPDEVLITCGAQHAFDLALRMLTSPGHFVVLGRPTYSMAHTLLRLHGVNAIEIAVGERGMDLECLQEVLEGTHVKLLYTMPNFHNPTGVTTDQAHRERLLALCEAHGVPIVEDGFEEEMKYFGHAVLPIKSLDARGFVLYVGTFSKVSFPGLRIGWIAAPHRAIAALSAIQHTSILAPNTLTQAAVARLCTSGEFASHLRRIHRVYRRRMGVLLHSLESFLPKGLPWLRPLGGYTVWLTLPGSVEDEERWVDRLDRAGVRVAPGRQYYGSAPESGHLRLSIARADEDHIVEGCRRIGRVLSY